LQDRGVLRHRRGSVAGQRLRAEPQRRPAGFPAQGGLNATFRSHENKAATVRDEDSTAWYWQRPRAPRGWRRSIAATSACPSSTSRSAGVRKAVPTPVDDTTLLTALISNHKP